MAKIFQTLRDKVIAKNDIIPAENRAMFWFRQHLIELTKWQHMYQRLTFNQLKEQTFTKQLVGANSVVPGFFYFFLYDPKGKNDLPYYDRFPFVLCLDNSEPGRFRGLNFHYLDYLYRARLFDLLYPFREGRGSHHGGASTELQGIRDIRMRLKMSYQLLKVSSKYRAFRPCFKEYLVSNVKTPLLKVGAREWDISIFLPVATFQKQTEQYVWKESQKMIR